ncbi:hypothetical protein [Herbaspirillum rubrisubalbicans]|nr:hypothetical protein [Herbaspirillum rubrisubalbicans]
MTEQFTTQTLKISDLLDDVEKNVLEELFGTEVVNAVENVLICSPI